MIETEDELRKLVLEEGWSLYWVKRDQAWQVSKRTDGKVETKGVSSELNDNSVARKVYDEKKTIQGRPDAPTPKGPPSDDEHGPNVSESPMMPEKFPIKAKDIGDYLKTTHTYHDLGETVFWKLHQAVALDPARFNQQDPEATAKYIVSEFSQSIDRMAGVIDQSITIEDKDHELNAKDAELIFTVNHLHRLQQKHAGLEGLYYTITAVLCDKCRERVMMTLGLQYFNKLTGMSMQAAKGDGEK